MKFALFALGFFTGTLAAYLVLTQFWWPDIRLEAARPRETSTPSPTPLSMATPCAVTPMDVPEQSPTPAPGIAEMTPSPVPSETAIQNLPPAETSRLELPLLQSDLDRLRARALLVPVQGVARASLRDTFTDDRGGQRHQAIDIMAPRGTPVLAVDDGHVEKLFTSKPGGLTIYEFDPQSQYCYYYAHLDSYAAGLETGKTISKGDVIGYVGSTGNASPTAPHLHFSIFRLGPDKRWWEGTAINAYPLWSPPARP